MTFLFFAGLGVLILGFSSMNWAAILFGVAALGYAVHKLDEREREQNRLRWEALRQESVARGNGKPHGSVRVVAAEDLRDEY